MTLNKHIALSSDHAAIELCQAIASHITKLGWNVVDIGPNTPESTHYPKHCTASTTLSGSDNHFGRFMSRCDVA